MKRKFLNKAFDLENISTKEKLALAITLLVLLIVILNVIHSFDKKESTLIDYDNFNVSNLINASEEITDNQVFWDLSKIILRIYLFV